MLTAESIHLSTLSDSYGAPLADYYLLPASGVLYVCWHGHLTAAAVVKGVKGSMPLMQEYPFERVLNDKRDTSGDWSEALPWLEYEWLPQAVAAGLRAIAYIVSPNLEAQIVSREFVEVVQKQIHISLFTNEEDAQKWLQTQ